MNIYLLIGPVNSIVCCEECRLAAHMTESRANAAILLGSSRYGLQVGVVASVADINVDALTLPKIIPDWEIVDQFVYLYERRK